MTKEDFDQIRMLFREEFNLAFQPAFEKAFANAFDKAFGPAFENAFGPAFENAFGPAFAKASREFVTKQDLRREIEKLREVMHSWIFWVESRLIKVENKVAHIQP